MEYLLFKIRTIYFYFGNKFILFNLFQPVTLSILRICIDTMKSKEKNTENFIANIYSIRNLLLAVEHINWYILHSFIYFLFYLFIHE